MHRDISAVDTAAKSPGIPGHADAELNAPDSASQTFSFWPQTTSTPVTPSAQPVGDLPWADRIEVKLCYSDCSQVLCASLQPTMLLRSAVIKLT